MFIRNALIFQIMMTLNIKIGADDLSCIVQQPFLHNATLAEMSLFGWLFQWLVYSVL